MIISQVVEDLQRDERPLEGVLDVDDVETTHVLLGAGNDTTTTPVTTIGDEDEVASIRLNKVGESAPLKVEANGVVDLDQEVGVIDGAFVVSDDVGDALVANRDLSDLEGS